MNLKTLIVFLAACTFSHQQCTTGCLKCQNSICVFCDSINLYALSGGACSLKSLPNCLIIDQSGRCLVCTTSAYLDTTSGVCVWLANLNSVAGCQAYASEGICGLCSPNYYLSANSCLAVANKISNCQVTDGNVCLQCASGYSLSLNQKICLANPSGLTCDAFAMVTCAKCATGTFLTQNAYIYSNFYSSASIVLAIKYFQRIVSNIRDVKMISQCTATTVSNCLSFSAPDVCTNCADGYFLMSGKCYQNPISVIKNCDVYLSLTQCISCRNGYFLTGNNICTAVTEILNCRIYASDQQVSTICRECNSNYYLLTNSCVLRVFFPISLCKTYDLISDKCLACLIGFVPTSDGLACLKSINNCSTYQSSSVSSNFLSCTACVNGFYYSLITFSCMQGTISNCQIYSTFQNTCVQCQPNFYLRNSMCYSQAGAENCQNYSLTAAMKCDTCLNGYFKFSLTNQCYARNTIGNCKTYATGVIGKCVSCLSGYYLANDASCIQIPTELNCNVLQSRFICSECKIGYYLSSGKCLANEQSTFLNCDLTTIKTGATSILTSLCPSCLTNNIPIDYMNDYVCTSQKLTRSLIGQTNFDSECLAYRKSNNQYVCVKCTSGLFPSGSYCLRGCIQGTKTHLSLGQFTLSATTVTPFTSASCIDPPGSLPNCKVSGPISSSSIGCALCNTGYLPLITLNSNSGILSTGFVFPRDFAANPLSKIPAATCFNTYANLRGIFSSDQQSILNCRFYYNVPTLSISGCFRCERGYNGPVLDHVYQCKTYTGVGVCSVCNTGFFLSSSVLCQAVTVVQFCATYSPNSDACITCSTNYYLNGAICSPVTPVTSCVTYQVNANQCSVCSAVTYLSGNSCLPVTTVTNCATYMPAQNACNTCNTGFVLLSGACYAVLTNCLSHTLVSGVAKCQTCDSSVSYLSNGSCILGTKTNCAVFAAGADSCTTCNANYYLSSGTCVAHTLVQYCANYDLNIANQCNSCNSNALYFKVNAACEAGVSNCKTHVSKTVCQTCIDGYYVNAAGSCVAILASENCRSKAFINSAVSTTDYTCTACVTGYFPSSKPITLSGTQYNQVTCRLDLTLWIKDCGLSASDGISQSNHKCAYCNTGLNQLSFSSKFLCLERDYLVYSLASTTFLSNCRRHSVVSSIATCLECMTGFLLVEGASGQPNTCAATCPANTYLITKFYVSASNSFDKKPLMCRLNKPADPPNTFFPSDGISTGANANSNCLVYSNVFGDDYAATIPYGCTKCATNYYPRVVFTNIGITTDPANFVSSYNLNSPLEFFPYITCVQTSAANLKSGGGAATVTNCEYYNMIATGTFSCLKCKLGFTGKVKKDTTVTPNTYYLNDCSVDMSTLDCKTTTSYVGFSLSLNYPAQPTKAAYNSKLNLPFSAIFSCHQCVTTANIPVAFMKAPNGVVTELRSYSLSSSPWDSVASGSEESMIRCLDMTQANFITTLSLTATSTFPPNCAMAFVDVSSATKDSTKSTSSSQDGTGLAVFCAACAPGYAPTFAMLNTDTPVIISCTLIPYCFSSVWINACSSCTFLFTTQINYSVCVDPSKVTDSNCYAADSTGACKICKKGFDKSGTNPCSRITASACPLIQYTDNYYVSNSNSYPVIDDATTSYFYSPFLGCNSCTDFTNYVLSDSFTDPSLICVTLNGYLSSTSIDGCTNYASDNSNNFICKVCSATYIITADGFCVLKQTKHAFCTRAVSVANPNCDPTSCISSQYVFLVDQCVANSIANCAIPTVISNAIACGTCSDGFEKSADSLTCTAFLDATYPNCALAVAGACTKCKTNYLLVTIGSSKQYCYPYNFLTYSPNCLTLTSTSPTFQNYVVACTSCDIGYYINGTPTIPYLCLSFNPANDPNCNYFLAPATGYRSGTISLTEQDFKCLSQKNVVTHYYTAATATVTARTAISNCASYNPNANNCLTCSTGYTVSADSLSCSITPNFVAGIEATHLGFIESCSLMANCQTTFYEGLNTFLTSLFSCHKCINTEAIPFAAGRFGKPFNGQLSSLSAFGYSPSSVGQNSFYTATGGKSVECLTPLFTSFNMQSNLYFFFPSNCAFGLINVDSFPDASFSNKTTNVDLNKIGVMCVACKPGYSPATATDTNGNAISIFVPICNQIQNCAGSNFVNACSQCSTGYAFEYLSATGISYNSCVAYSDANCFAARNNAGVWACMYCKSGYKLNVDGVCEDLIPPQCSDATQFALFKNFDTADFQTGLYLSKNGTGCQSCNSNFFAIFQDSPYLICTPSTVNANNLFPAITNYIKNCVNYMGDSSTMGCYKCANGFIITSAKTCISASILAFCDTATSTTACAKCLPGYNLINNLCAINAISNCATYLQQANNPTQTCLTCNSGFFLQNNQCIAGTVANCNTFSSVNVCSGCVTGYALGMFANSATFCLKIPTSTGCSVLDNASFQSGSLSCTTCTDPTFTVQPTPFNTAPNTCIKTQVVGNCQSYSFGNLMVGSSLACSQCNTGFYLNQTANLCVLRKILPTQCSTYSPTSDVCLACSASFALTTGGLSCIPKPYGIFGCSNYTTNYTCSLCSSGYYLANNTCIELAANQLVSNCLLHSAPLTCSNCTVGYYLQGNTCVIPTAINCLTYTSSSICATCPPGFGLQTTGLNTNCVAVSIPLCVSFTSVAPFVCLTCLAGYYPSGGSCLAVPSPIAGCIVYDSPFLCRTCSPSTVLSSDKTSCITPYDPSILDPLCQSNVQGSAPTCVTCPGGYYFINGTCTGCGGNTGCFACEPNGSNRCQLCSSGYFMDVTGSCISNSNAPAATPTTSGSATTSGTTNTTTTFSAGGFLAQMAQDNSLLH